MTERAHTRRADARANRARILAVARVALAADPAASLSAIGRTAGVGQGTLYRHFPSREALVLGVYRQEIDAIVALAPALLRAHPPVQAFRLWCDRLAEFGRMKHGVAALLRAAISKQDVDDTYGPMVGTVRRLLEACEAAGDIRAGADADDVLTLLSVLWHIPPTADGKARADRLIALVLRGLGAVGTAVHRPS
ncbi:TetR family transcriptional regulator [Gemmatimonadetes bacterium T265]|nr:TetR family transcriptional regulator [Gemmatimonadetes bacterium T265]